ncbi:MAG: ABC transporter substrate-binding protein [Tannerella sp.]|jgi:iron complex transport system substrate-binding protein|nr:ABC transporter substrate-binding protein [Tannerella sp.]
MKKAIGCCCLTAAFLLAAACGPAGKPAAQGAGISLRADSNAYARGFRVAHAKDYISVEVRNPWDTTRLLERYLLVPRTRPLPAGLPQGQVLRTPVGHLAVYTSVYVSMIEALGCLDSIAGVCEPRYMISDSIRARVAWGEVADLGAATSPNIERMMARGIACVVASPFQNAGYGGAEKLGVPIVAVPDYMETLPLGRAEWLRFFGLLLDKEALADSLFRQTEARYDSLRRLAATAKERPAVLSETMYGGFWYVPGRDSYIAHFYHDAGARNAFDYLPGTASIPLAFEAVLDKAMHADFWLMKYNLAKEKTYAELRDEYPSYADFDAFSRQHIYTCNTGKAFYYEESPIHPDYLLRDLIHIFHPGLLPGYAPRYFHPMTGVN